METSQAVTAALLGALGAAAASQGTMNNLTFGDDRYQYYETHLRRRRRRPGLGRLQRRAHAHDQLAPHRPGGAGVALSRCGWRSSACAPAAAATGAHRGGDGAVRRLRFLEPLTAAIVSSSRRVPPYGLAGGLPGACGRNAVERADGSVEELPGVAQTRMAPGDVLVVETPGGGGYGAPPGEQPRRAAGWPGARCGHAGRLPHAAHSRRPAEALRPDAAPWGAGAVPWYLRRYQAPRPQIRKRPDLARGAHRSEPRTTLFRPVLGEG